MSALTFYGSLALLAVVAGTIRLLLARDPVVRLISMNVVGLGSLLLLIALAARSDSIDPVLSALVITGLVITVAFTGVGAVLVRRLESPTLADVPEENADLGETEDRDASREQRARARREDEEEDA